MDGKSPEPGQGSPDPIGPQSLTIRAKIPPRDTAGIARAKAAGCQTVAVRQFHNHGA